MMPGLSSDENPRESINTKSADYENNLNNPVLGGEMEIKEKKKIIVTYISCFVGNGD